MAPFDEDLDEFLDSTEFAQSGLFGTTSVRGIYTAQNADVFDVDGVRPTFLVKDSDIASLSVKNGSVLNLLTAGLFYVRSIQPDGTGMSLLILEAT